MNYKLLPFVQLNIWHLNFDSEATTAKFHSVLSTQVDQKQSGSEIICKK